MIQQTRELRMSGIGGSDAAVVLGMSKWKTPLQLYMEKTNQVPVAEENQAMHFGNVLERVIAEEYSRRTGSKVRNVNETLRHPEREWMMAHIDRKVVGTEKFLECKTAGRYFSSAEWGKDGSVGRGCIPDYYYVQVQHCIGVTSYPYADVAALLSGNDYRIYHFEKDAEMIERIVEEEAKFWECVMNRVPPAPRSLDDIKLLFPKDERESIVVNEETSNLLDIYSLCLKEKDWIEEKIERLKMKIQEYMGDNALLIDSEGKKLISWKVQERETFDSKLFKKDNPDVYAKYVKKTSTRVFR